MKIKAIFYDLDGVLADACELHYLALNKALHKICSFTISRTEHETVYNALPTKKKLELMARQDRIKSELIQVIFDEKQAMTKEAIMQSLSYDQSKVDLHNYTKSLGIRSACVTNSITETAELMLKQTGQLEYMEFVISNEMVKNAKPHGEGYLRAMVRTGLMPEEVLIVEDSDKGVAAANAVSANILRVHGPNDVIIANVKMALGV